MFFVVDAQLSLDAEATHTADLILFLDKLFDSLNSGQRTGPPGKPLKAAVSKNTEHFHYWYQAIQILNSMKFYCPQKKRLVTVPSLKNLIHTLKGFIYLLKNILLQHKNNFILVRAFQQDALENFFGCIRNYSGQESNPSALHFISSFKALLVNNFMSAHSVGANCEDDSSEGALENLRYFLTSEVLPGIARLDSEIDDIEIPPSVTTYKKTQISRCTITYISGFIARKTMKKVNCTDCKKKFLFREHNNDVDFIEARQYNFSSLMNPGTYFTFLCSQSLCRLFYLIPRACHYDKISMILQKIILSQLNFRLVNCPQHINNDKILSHIIVRCSLFFWCKRVNLIAKGKDGKFNRVFIEESSTI